LNTDDPSLVARWTKAEDRPGFGVYYTPNPLKPGARTHGKDSIAAIEVLFVDIDLKDLEEGRAEVERRLARVPLRPSWIVSSGHGFHVGFEVKEPIECGTPEFEEACELQACLTKCLGGDPQVRPWSLLRYPGTTNSKHVPAIQCHVIREALDVRDTPRPQGGYH
jgi:hypothetical protein